MPWEGRTDLWDRQAFCMSEIKLHLIAKSCLIPGFCTLISNLTRSAISDVSCCLPHPIQTARFAIGRLGSCVDSTSQPCTEFRADVQVPSNADVWIKEYAMGTGYEIYRVPLSPYFRGLFHIIFSHPIHHTAASHACCDWRLLAHTVLICCDLAL